MKFSKLNTHGFAHHIALLLVVIGVVAGGAYYVVASKADSYSQGNPTLSKRVCQNPYYNRVWTGPEKGGTCQKSCLRGTAISGSVYDRCVVNSAIATSSNKNPTTSQTICQSAPYYRLWETATNTCSTTKCVIAGYYVKDFPQYKRCVKGTTPSTSPAASAGTAQSQSPSKTSYARGSLANPILLSCSDRNAQLLGFRCRSVTKGKNPHPFCKVPYPYENQPSTTPIYTKFINSGSYIKMTNIYCTMS